MTGMAMGLAARWQVPFVSTFACFLTRAFDFIRMAAISNLNIKFVGTHAGVSIGEDGPSQMGLEESRNDMRRTEFYGALSFRCDQRLESHRSDCRASWARLSARRTPQYADPLRAGGTVSNWANARFCEKSDRDRALIVAAALHSSRLSRLMSNSSRRASRYE